MSAPRHSRAPEENLGLFFRTENHHKLLCLADLVEMLKLPIGLEDAVAWFTEGKKHVGAKICMPVAGRVPPQ